MSKAIKVKIGDLIFYGYESPCPNWLKKKYREAVNFTCQDCKKHESEVGTLEIHRIIRGCEDGLYTVLPLNHMHSNVKVLCSVCHKRIHYGEFK